MTPLGRGLRLAVAIVLCAALAWGTFRGEDDAFPIGPLRMYATRQRLDGRVSWYQVRAVDGAGIERFVSGAELGMRRAEVEGQVPRIVEQPDLLCLLAEAAGAGDAAEVRLVKVSRSLDGGRPTGESTETVVATCRT